MSHTSKTTKKRTQTIRPHTLALAALCVLSSFTLGIRTAGDVQTVAPTEASDLHLAGDMDMDGHVTLQDVILLLEIAERYTDPTVQQIRNDPNNDGQLTTDDAIRLLYDLR